VGRLTVPYAGLEKRAIKHELHGVLSDLKSYNNENGTIAFVFEPILGEGGIIVPDPEGLIYLVELLRSEGIWIIADEIQTGLGRTGAMFACQHYGIEPDMVLLSKSLGGGMPISAVVADADMFPDLEKGMHSGSFHWTPVSVAAAIASLNVIEESIPWLEAMGDIFLACIEEICSEHKDIVTEVRGKGHMVGVEFETVKLRDKFIWKAKTAHKDTGLLLHSCGEKALRIYPRINADPDELELCANLFEKTFNFM
jgi:acetylornithine/succinyldiaminopimelate/putrescine aminotransferase